MKMVDGASGTAGQGTAWGEVSEVVYFPLSQCVSQCNFLQPRQRVAAEHLQGLPMGRSSRAWAASAPLAQVITLILSVRVQLGVKTHAQVLCH